MKISTVFTLILTAFALALVVLSVQYPIRASLFPYIVGIPTVIIGVIIVARDLRGGASVKGENVGQWLSQLRRNLSFLAVLAWIVGLIAAIYLFGYYVAIPAFLIAFLKGHRRSWRFSVVTAAVTSVILYLAFVVGFRFDFHEGLLFSLFY